MAGRSNHPMYKSDSLSDDLESGSANYTAMSTQQLERRREEDLARQDALLDNIHVGVKGLKQHAHAINGEVLEQNEMIDDIDSRMDRAQQDIARQEEKARDVNAKKKQVCKLYGIIALLIVILIVVWVIPSPK
uniref:t-SNARE coiled-coil homology domain-containing protein n=1 Tax=Globisporangium ultimum (strain ATCC 200006 / CBS 805.95 / DAOM BR144) TaxID=431595 RepID=K3X5D1_GLOUD